MDEDEVLHFLLRCQHFAQSMMPRRATSSILSTRTLLRARERYVNVNCNCVFSLRSDWKLSGLRVKCASQWLQARKVRPPAGMLAPPSLLSNRRRPFCGRHPTTSTWMTQHKRVNMLSADIISCSVELHHI